MFKSDGPSLDFARFIYLLGSKPARIRKLRIVLIADCKVTVRKQKSPPVPTCWE